MKRLRFWIGMGLSLATLVWVLQGIRLADVWTALQGINYLLLVPSLILVLISMWVRAVRWRLLFSPTPHLNLLRFFFVLNIGYLANNLLPLRAGDLARAYLISDEEGVSKARTLSTVLLEHVLDTMIVIVCLVLVVPFLPFLPPVVRQSGTIMGATVLGVMIVLVILSNQKKRALSVLRRLLSPVIRPKNEKLYRWADSLLEGLSALRSPRVALKIIGWSLLVWLCTALLAYVLFLAFDMHLPLAASVFVVCVTSLGIAVPSSPGYIGVYHSLVVLALTVYSVEKSLAFSYALVLHGWQYILLVILGVFSLWKMRLSYADLSKVEVKVEVGAVAKMKDCTNYAMRDESRE